MCSCDDNGPEAMWESKPKAKKRHKCSECRGWIEAGEVYTRIRGIWDGEPHTYAQCSDCVEFIDWAHDQSECLCLTFGNSHSDILDDAHESGEAQYKAEAKARVKAIRDKRRDKVKEAA